MTPLHGPVLVTGGGSGIGQSLAHVCARRGAAVVVTDVSGPAAADTARAIRALGGRAEGLAMDVTSAASVAAARADMLAKVGPPAVIVNNAGIVEGGPFLAVPLDHHLRTYHVNVLGMVTVTHAFLPDLVARGRGHVVNIASASGFIGLPFASTYASSKWAVIGFSESLRLELRELGHREIRVTTVCPGYVTTGLFDGARAPLLTPPLTAARLAESVVRAIERGRPFVRVPLMVALTPTLRGLLPLRVFDAIARLFGVNTSMRSWKGRRPD